MPAHRRAPNRKNWIYTAIVVAVAVFIAILGFGGSSKNTSQTAQTTPASSSPTASARAAKPTAKATEKPSETPTEKPTPSPTPTPSATSTGIGTSSATLGALAQSAKEQPVHIQIPALRVSAQIIAANVAPSGALEVPDNVIQAAWYQAGTAPGQPGTAIVAAHVDFAGKLGLFNQLHALPKGALIYITDAGGTVHKFRATTGVLAPKSDPSTVEALAAASAAPGKARLALITCGGDLDSAAHSYYDNYVLLADV